MWSVRAAASWTCAMVASVATAVGAFSLFTSSPTVRCSSSSAPDRGVRMEAVSAPTEAECSTSWRMVSASCPPTAARSTGSIPLAETSRLAIVLIHTSSGRNTHTNAREGTPMIVAASSGWAIAHDLGAISPATRCRNVTSNRDRANETTSATPAGAPNELSAGPSQASTAGLVTAPRANVHAVTPSWAPASMTVSSSSPRIAARADGLRAASASSRCRRAPRSANSMITKNALAMISPSVAATTTRGLLMMRRPPRRRRGLRPG